jgi:hypothetical protein
MYVPRATYSLRMSFWIVPRSLSPEMPCSSATAMYIASSVEAVELMVIDVEILSSGSPRSSTRMSSIESMATPTLPTSPCASGMIGVAPHLRRQIEGDGEARLPLLEQVVVARVGGLGRAEAAYWRIVHRRPRYMFGCTPRVKGGSPGKPRSRSASKPSAASVLAS